MDGTCSGPSGTVTRSCWCAQARPAVRGPPASWLLQRTTRCNNEAIQRYTEVLSKSSMRITSCVMPLRVPRSAALRPSPPGPITLARCSRLAANSPSPSCTQCRACDRCRPHSQCRIGHDNVRRLADRSACLLVPLSSSPRRRNPRLCPESGYLLGRAKGPKMGHRSFTQRVNAYYPSNCPKSRINYVYTMA